MTHLTWHNLETAAGIAGHPDSRRFGGRGHDQKGAGPRALGRMAAVVIAAVATLALWRQRARQRRALAQLDDRTLRDIGITRLDAARECEKPFWR